MTFRSTLRVTLAALILGGAFAGMAGAQSKPTANAIKLSRELMELTGELRTFDPAVVGAIEGSRRLLIQGNPTLVRDIDAVAAKLRDEIGPKRDELHNMIADAYALFMTEQEIKDVIAFYKSPAGKKLLAARPKAVEATLQKADEWSAKFGEEIMGRMRSELRKKGLNPI
jgi:hypothetical protein